MFSFSSVLRATFVAIVSTFLISALPVTTNAQPISNNGLFSFDSPLTSTNSRFAPHPDYGCLSGLWNQAHPQYSQIKTIKLTVGSTSGPTIKLTAKEDACDTDAVNPDGTIDTTCKYWKICLGKRVQASVARFQATIEVRSSSNNNNFILDSAKLTDMTFDDLIVHDGQSNSAFPIEAYFLPLPAGTGTAASYNLSSLFLNEWRQNKYYNVAIMMTPSAGASGGASTTKDVFPVVQIPWIRPEQAGYEAALMKFGWHAFSNCVEHAKLGSGGGVHCLQVAVFTTRIESHMAESDYIKTGMRVRKPFTTAGTELLNPVGWFWNGIKWPLRNSQPSGYHWLQGESNFVNPQEYGTLLSVYLDSLESMFEESSGKAPFFVVYRLAHFCVAASNPPFAATAESQTIVRYTWPKSQLCLVTTRDLGYNSARDNGLHWTTTKYHASVRGAQCYARHVLKNKALITKAPRIQGLAGPSYYNPATGQVQVALQFKTQKDPATGDCLKVTLTPTPACTTCLNSNSTLFKYEQINSTAATETWIKNPTFVFSDQEVLVSWFVDGMFSIKPTRLIYQPLTTDYFPQSSLTNEITAADISAPLPSEPFSIAI